MKKVFQTGIFLFCFKTIALGQFFDPTLAGKLQFKIDSMRVAGNLRGISLCVIRPGIGTWTGVSGISHPGTPIHPGMEFGIGSNTKLFTGVLMLKLAEKGIISLNDSLHSFLPAYPNIDSNITIRQLLNHTSGLFDVTSVSGYSDSILANPGRVFKTEELMKWMGPPLFSPGKGWNYCNTNYLLAGLIAERATGKTYARLLRDSILSPLKLDSTFLDVYESVPTLVAHPWQAGKDNFLVPRVAVNSAAWSAGAMYSTASEMAQWYQALMNGRVLNAISFSEMTTFVGSGDYGIGLFRTDVQGRTVWQHGGSIWGGYNSSMLYETASGIIISVLINQQPAKAFQVSAQLLSVLTSQTLDTDEKSSNNAEIKIFPNPADEEVVVQTPGSELLEVKIVSPVGHLMSTSANSEINVSWLPSGTYFVVVETTAGIFRSKLLIR